MSSLINPAPDIIFASITGPGVGAPAVGYSRYLYIVYSFPLFTHLGYHDCIPEIKQKTIDLAISRLPARFKTNIDKFIMADEAVFLERCWQGHLWPIMSLYSPIAEVFTESGNIIVKHRNHFLTKEAVKRWMSNVPKRKTDIAVDHAAAVAYGEIATGKSLNTYFTSTQIENNKKILQSLKYTKQEMARVSALASVSSLGNQVSRSELNDLLIAVRMIT